MRVAKLCKKYFVCKPGWQKWRKNTVLYQQGMFIKTTIFTAGKRNLADGCISKLHHVIRGMDVNMKRIILLIIGGVFLVVDATDVHPSPVAGAGIDIPDNGLVAEQLMELSMVALYDFHFKKADSITGLLIKEHPDHYLSYFARANYYWWVMVTHPPDAQRSEEFSKMIDRARKQFDKQAAFSENPSLPLLFHAIGLYAMSIRYDLSAGNYFRAAAPGRRLVSVIHMAKGREDDFKGLYIATGLYNYLAAAAIQRYPLMHLYRLFYSSGDKMLGLSQLQQAADSGHELWQTEADYFLMRIYLDMEMDVRQSLAHAERLTSRFPGNLIYQYYHLQALKTGGYKQAATEKAEEIRRLTKTNPEIHQDQKGYFISLIDR